MRVKVVHLVTRLDLGGAQLNTLYTASHLDPERFEAVLACGPGGRLDEEARALAEAGRLRLHWAPDLVREVDPLRDLSALLHLSVFLRQEAPQVVHTHSSKAGILGRVAARLAGVPRVVHTFHGFGFHERQRPLTRRAYVAIERAAARLADRLVFVSQANLESAARERIGLPERRMILRSGVESGRLPAPLASREKKKAELGARMHQPLVVSVGNLKPQKNPMDFILLAEAVLKKSPEARFLFVGDGPMRARLEAALIAKRLHGKVLFPGWRRDVPEILAAADAFVLTSLWEGLPRSLVEAMKTGLPCVCYATDGVKDVVRDAETGFLVTPGDWETAARIAQTLVSDEALRARIGTAAAASIGPEFDIDLMVRRQEELYSELLGARA